MAWTGSTVRQQTSRVLCSWSPSSTCSRRRLCPPTTCTHGRTLTLAQALAPTCSSPGCTSSAQPEGGACGTCSTRCASLPGRGKVWAVGAWNVGNSTLLNVIARCSGAEGGQTLTEAPVPGTTLGVIRVDGVLGAQAKLFDMPGLLHGHQLMSRLTREEQKLVQVSKEMRPRTYRIKAGQSIFEETGFSVSKIVSQADSMTNKLKSSKKTNKKKESKASSCPSATPESSEPSTAIDA